ncbi:unnamed protein product [Gongylonema pulchrum]|uniref:Secreted protein n=1 Tax=Gongylonema pulchrum TaxID=637853 RepID=A0A183DBY1_9BILA|nr:unnamed protein product [Gongylonema pulchrum]
MYIDLLWVIELLFIVFFTSFSLYATYLLPIQYCDLIHRCATHLGKWVQVERIAATAGNSTQAANLAAAIAAASTYVSTVHLTIVLLPNLCVFESA